jgi:hypothetical protein
VLWHAQHGATAEQYRNALAERGVQNIPDHLFPPPELPGVGAWVQAFFELATDRRFIGGPIPWSAIAAFPVAADEADAFRRCIRNADAAYLAFVNRPPEERKSAPPMMPGGAFR